MGVPDQCLTRLDMLMVVSTKFTLIVTTLVKRLLVCHIDGDVGVRAECLVRHPHPVVREVAGLRVGDLHAHGVGV